MRKYLVAGAALGALLAMNSAGAVDLSLAGGNPNKLVVLEYLTQIDNGDRAGAVKAYAAPGFINHREAGMTRPAGGGAGGPPGGGAPGGGAAATAAQPIEIEQIIAEGDLVAVHYLGHRSTGQTITSMGRSGVSVGDNVVDIFKLQNGKIVEKWDAIESITNMGTFK